MKIETQSGDAAVLRELGARVAQRRLARNLTQAQLAEQAGVGVATVRRFERGRSADMTTVIRVLRALGRLDALDLVLPELTVSPLEQFERGGRRRRRATGARSKTGGARGSWRWGDEDQDAAR